MLVIFDCDGVLVDTEPLSNRCFAEALNREGLDWDVAETMRRLMGRSMRSCIEIVEAELGRTVPGDFVERLQDRTFACFRDEGVHAVPGVIAALDALERAGAATCVASSGDHGKMRITLGGAGLWDRFDGRIFSATQVARGKPAPDLFLFAARRMGMPAGDSIVIEDSAAGAQAARAAGMRAYGYVGAPHTDRAGLVEAGATLFDDMRRLPSLLGMVAA
ncbi:MAG: HAD-IA family hydrolase [Alphaproteobacteria bacterium]|nr:HAD-IA family hydrolase [Alphaproteobacteria bacterium]MCW5743552.1 HAD-IA family hydrolase [Alphaproteobacteria bacterium]